MVSEVIYHLCILSGHAHCALDLKDGKVGA